MAVFATAVSRLLSPSAASRTTWSSCGVSRAAGVPVVLPGDWPVAECGQFGPGSRGPAVGAEPFESGQRVGQVAACVGSVALAA
ncbi:hypothetical protein AOZ06_39130 [Kibdelosporangium phytohabitans]|uniref:Uncharacterized protein n=1 Tax=Kibdelosporangium phytohabitans TaxID=860235 RepID=A0A0N9I7A9_9PSEU|nr:hypothetical protein AOZ06_39130 [Kibdelosporangium phytohabitans]